MTKKITTTSILKKATPKKAATPAKKAAAKKAAKVPAQKKKSATQLLAEGLTDSGRMKLLAMAEKVLCKIDGRIANPLREKGLIRPVAGHFLLTALGKNVRNVLLASAQKKG